MLNGLNQVKGFEQKLKGVNGVNNVNMPTIYENVNGWKQIK